MARRCPLRALKEGCTVELVGKIRGSRSSSDFDVYRKWGKEAGVLNSQFKKVDRFRLTSMNWHMREYEGCTAIATVHLHFFA
jgi:hypothetical protein